MVKGDNFGVLQAATRNKANRKVRRIISSIFKLDVTGTHRIPTDGRINVNLTIKVTLWLMKMEGL